MEPTTKRPQTVEIPEDTATVLLVTDHYWGKGDTLDAAKAQLKREGGRLTWGYLVYTFPADVTEIWVDGMGYVRWTGTGPTTRQIVHGTRTTR